jgi:hypothetical protein
MSVERGTDGPDAIRVEQRIRRADRLATGTLACPVCDAPVAPAGPMTPAQRIGCPYCGHAGAVRDFLSLAAPSRPARVAVRVVRRARSAATR